MPRGVESSLSFPRTSRQHGTEGFEGGPRLGNIPAEKRKPLGRPMANIPFWKVMSQYVFSFLTLRKLVFHFLSNCMGYDRGDSLPFDFEPNGIHWVQNRKENCHHDQVPINSKGIGNIVFSVYGQLQST